MNTGKNRLIKEEGDVLHIDISTWKFPDEQLIITKGDWEKLLAASGGGKWSCTRPTKGDYAHPKQAGAYANRKKIFAHRVLLPNSKAVVFHDDNKLNLLPENIKGGSPASCRRKQAHRDSATGERCVTPTGGKYRLDVHHEGTTYYMGLFDAAEDAAILRDEIEQALPDLNELEAIEFFKSLKD